jgi:hypothetical protein
MPNKFRVVLILFFSAFFILTLTRGIVLYLEFLSTPPEYTFYGYDRSFSSALSLLFAGFENLRILFESAVVALPFMFSAIQLFNSDISKNRRRSTLSYAVIISLFLTVLWFIKESLLLIGKDANDVLFRWNEIESEMIILLLLSFLIYLLLVFTLSKQIFKSRSAQ